MTASTPLLEMQGIEKVFPGVKALDRVGLEVMPGQVVALIGENGAGKSTLMNILGGVLQADAGEIKIDGKQVRIQSASSAMRHGIGFIHQELNVLDNISVAGNVFLGREPLWGGPLKLIDRKKLRELAIPWLERLGLLVSVDELVGDLSIARKQMVEVAKALTLNARLLIMDEPTSSLTMSESKRLFSVIRDLRSSGVSIIYISHRLAEVPQVADRVVGLRDGRNAGELDCDGICHDDMVRLMIGRELESVQLRPAKKAEPGFFKAEGISTKAWPGRKISFEVGAGEILGFAGLVGAGRSEMARAIFGIDRALAGSIVLGGREVRVRSVRDAVSRGIFMVPEDRRTSGLITEMSVRENITLPGLGNHARLGLIDLKSETDAASAQCESLKVKTPGVEAPVKNLSGGNQQKVVFGKWLGLEPKVIIFDEPTRGVDVGAKGELYLIMRSLADAGVAVIVISSEMEEILGISDRIAVMHEGRITGVLERDEFSEEAVMNLATGPGKAPEEIP